MPTRFRVSVLEFAVLAEIEGTRSAPDYVALLDRMEFGDTSGLSESELREMCLMSLQDLEPEAAAAIVLEHDLGGQLRKGQITQVAHAMPDERLWEMYADMALHERLFHVASLLHAAFPQVFPETDAVRVTLELTAENGDARAIIAEPLGESFIVRLIADGMPAGALLHRLFEDQLAGTSFPEAASIMWIVTTESLTERSVKLDVISSSHWLDPLRETRAYESSAYPDDAPVPNQDQIRRFQ